MSLSPPAISVEKLSYSYGSRKVLQDLSLTVASGQCAVLLGPNGAGKTTLFSLMTRLLANQMGKISVAGGDGSRVGIVFQQSALDIDLTVRQNLSYYAGLHGLSRGETETRIASVAQHLTLQDRLADKVRDLNGGHRRRVEIARALMAEPAVLLLDEPTVGLDIPTRKSLVAMLHGLSADRKLTILWATHLIDEVWPTDHVLVLSHGKIAAEGSTAALLKSSRVKTFDEAYTALTAGQNP